MQLYRTSSISFYWSLWCKLNVSDFSYYSASHLDLTSQGVELQDEGLAGGGVRWGERLEGEALLLGTEQQSVRQVRLVEQQVEEVSRCDAVEGFGAGAEVQSGTQDAPHPVRLLTAQNPGEATHRLLHQLTERCLDHMWK